MPLAMEQAGELFYFAYDQVGSLRAVSDSHGVVQKSVLYDSFGRVISDSNPELKVPFGFAGGLQDNDSGLVRFGYRDYGPEVGRWTSKDPIGFDSDDANIFRYCFADPVNLNDPLGQTAAAAPAPAGVALGKMAAEIAAAAARLGISAGACGNPVIAGLAILIVLATPDEAGDATLPEEISTCPECAKQYVEMANKDGTEPKGGHSNNKRPSSKEKHERGDKRRGKDQGGEKKDKRMPYRK
ncbi:RHS repeat domain-containing protein [Megalodesulfovibrio paquesii]